MSPGSCVFRTPPHRTRSLGVWRGAALYVGSLIGPGVLLIPALARQVAGPASVIAWGVLLLLSLPLAYTFGALAVRMPVAGGVSAYARAGLGLAAGAVTGGWFVTAVLIGAPVVALIGGYYVADLTGAGAPVAAALGLTIFALVLGINATGLRLSSGVQLVVAAILSLIIAVAVVAVLPSRLSEHWTPFLPHGWVSVGTAASILVWLFVGWEAVAQLAVDFDRPAQVPRAIAVSFGIMALLYIGLALTTVVATSGPPTPVPLADLIALGFGTWGRDATAMLAVVLTMGTMNVYLGSAAKLAAALAEAGTLPRWLAGDAYRTIPRRPLIVIAAFGLLEMAAVVVGRGDATDQLVRATSACFVMVYVAVCASAARLLAGRGRVAAAASALLTGVVAAFSGWFLLVPAASVLITLLSQRWAVGSRPPGPSPTPCVGRRAQPDGADTST